MKELSLFLWCCSIRFSNWWYRTWNFLNVTVWATNLLLALQLPSLWASWLIGLGNRITCETFVFQPLLWLLEFMIFLKSRSQYYPSFKYIFKLKYLNVLESFLRGLIFLRPIGTEIMECFCLSFNYLMNVR